LESAIHPNRPAKGPAQGFTDNRVARRRVGRDAGGVADELLSHLAALVGSEVKVTLEIEGKEPNGVPENTVRIVTENRPYSEIRYAGI
jgi:hypothetical protein